MVHVFHQPQSLQCRPLPYGMDVWASFHTPWLSVEALCFLHHPLPSLPLILLIKTYTCHVFVSIDASFASEDVGLYYVVRDVSHDS